MGLIIGSFLNAVIYRLPREISLVNPRRSICPKCSNSLKWSNNIPLFSWLIQGGKCSFCKEKISITYPIIEAATGLLAIFSLYFYGATLTGLFCFIFLSVLLVITMIDLEHMIIPDKINKPGMIIGLLLGAANEYYNFLSFPFSQSLLSSVSGLILGYGTLYLIAWFFFKMTGLDGLGGGDIKLMGFSGALLGAGSIMPTLILGSLAGICAAVFAMIFKKAGLRTELPFGPWLALGMLLYMIHIDPVILIQTLTQTGLR